MKVWKVQLPREVDTMKALYLEEVEKTTKAWSDNYSRITEVLRPKKVLQYRFLWGQSYLQTKVMIRLYYQSE